MMGKLAYTKGTVLIQCPGCQSRHLIADHLNWFDLGKRSIEQILEDRGETIRRHIGVGGSNEGGTIELLPNSNENM